MSLIQKIDEDIKNAMKSKDAERLSTLRMTKAAMTHLAISKKKDHLDDQEAIEVIEKQVKQRKESYESFVQAGRIELADKENRELKVLLEYLPSQLSEDEVEKLARDVIQKLGAQSPQAAGMVMKELMPLVKGKADGKTVSAIVSKLLQ